MASLVVTKDSPPLGLLVAYECVKNGCKIHFSKGDKTSLTYDSYVSSSEHAIMRYLARSVPNLPLYGNSIIERTEVDHWLTFSMIQLNCKNDFPTALEYLNTSLAQVTYLVGTGITIADIAVWGALKCNSALNMSHQEGKSLPHLSRYMKYLDSLPNFSSVLALYGCADKTTTEKKEFKEEGKFIDLPHAEKGKVVVRFPPEASGYLHIGHTKAALLNQYYQVNFDGKLIMRFDDTNPEKENAHFEKVILEDVEKLGIKYDKLTYTSDSFDICLDYCDKLLKDGKAFLDDTDNEIMKTERMELTESKHRNNSVEKNLQLWEEMKKGSENGKKFCVRAKIDMKSANGCMRDPAIYRFKDEPHIRTGNKYNVYPTYDFACPIVDSIEGVTHALRTTEYHDRDEQFYWFISALGLRKPHIWEYSRLNLQNTVLSKRKLAWFVEEGLVDGWDDPRMPTVRGILRKGMTVEGLKQFIIAQGSSRAVVTMDWEKIWSFNKKVIDPIAPRYTALLKDEMIEVHVNGVERCAKDVQKHPKDKDIGMKKIWYDKKVYIDGADAETLTVNEMVTFINWGNLTIKEIKRDETTGKVIMINADPNFSNTDYKKTQKITWIADVEEAPAIEILCLHHENIISKAVLAPEDDFKNFINYNSKKEYTMKGDNELSSLKKGDMIQLQRRGFYICDSQYEDFSRHSGRCSPLVLIHIPDGHVKEMPKAGSKHKDASKADTGNKNPPKPREKAQKKKEKPVETSAPALDGKQIVSMSAHELNEKIIEKGNIIRKLKGDKASKADIDVHVKELLSLKASFKSETGNDWNPNIVLPSPSDKSSGPNLSDEAKNIDKKIVLQGDKIRDLKSKKDSKENIDAAVKILLSLKAEYKAEAGLDWTPPKPVTNVTKPPEKVEKKEAPNKSISSTGLKISDQIQSQGDKIRDLKSKKDDKANIDAAVKILLSLKAEYKAETGIDWTPPKPAANTTKPSEKVEKKETPKKSISPAGLKINDEIQSQGDKIRDLKSKKVDKAALDPEIKALLSLKAKFKSETGEDWKPDVMKLFDSSNIKKVETTNMGVENTAEALELKNKIDQQGNKVRDLKSCASPQDVIKKEVSALLELKAQYKKLTGVDIGQSNQKSKKPAAESKKPATESKKKAAESKKPAAESQKQEAESSLDMKKITRLGLEAVKEENLPDWYSQVITKAEMIEYYDVSGCYVLRPWSFAIWESISQWFDGKIKEMGFQNCYFPMFVSNAALQKEKEHIEDFAPEVAWVTRSGDTELAEPIAVRPTSETVMYPAYAKWVQSHRDLPIKLNQWCNVVRWEFKHPQPFLRTREFLWQEGHSAYATYKEANEEVHAIINLYEEIYETLLAIPVVKGKKTQKEKFAGGDFTTTVEAFISATGRAIQAATSHHLGQNFSKMFNISFENPETKEKDYAYQNSWAITTRSIGVIVMVHGDNMGLVLPPRIASIQIVIVPCGITVSLSDEEKNSIIEKCEELEKSFKAAGIRTKGDYRDNYSPGWKFNHWELKGVPIRVELGARDMKKNQFIAVRRDTGDKITVPNTGGTEFVKNLLETIQSSMYAKAKKELDENKVMCEDFDVFCDSLNQKKILLSPFCGEIPCEEKIKKLSARDVAEEEGAPAMGAKGLCIPFNQPKEIELTTKCICPGCPGKPKYYTLFGRSY